MTSTDAAVWQSLCMSSKQQYCTHSINLPTVCAMPCCTKLCCAALCRQAKEDSLVALPVCLKSWGPAAVKPHLQAVSNTKNFIRLC